MATLTRTQIDHAKHRMYEAKQAYITARTEHLGQRPTVIDFSPTEKLEMVRKGTARLKDSVDTDRYGHFLAAFDYPSTRAQLTSQAALKKWQAAVDAVTAKAQKIETQLLDELIMSPDGAAALARIAGAFA